MLNREGYKITSTHRECVRCGCLFAITSKMPLCPSCNSSRVKAQPSEKKMLRRAKARAKKNAIVFSIQLEDVHIPVTCPILDIPLVEHKGSSGGRDNSPSLDRIDNTQGYIQGNVWVISQLANKMKSNASDEELEKFAKWVLYGR